MKRQFRKIRTRPGPIIFLLVWCIVGGIIGVWVNNRYYAIERGEMNPSDP